MEVYRPRAYEEYAPTGSRIIQYGLLDLNSKEWHGGGKEFNPVGGLMPNGLVMTENAARELAAGFTNKPAGLVIVKVYSVYLPMSIMENENADIRDQGPNEREVQLEDQHPQANNS